MEEMSATTDFQPPAPPASGIVPAEPIPPSENSKPFPTPFEMENCSTNNDGEMENGSSNNDGEMENGSTKNDGEMENDSTNNGNAREVITKKWSLNKVRDGKIYKRNKRPKMFKPRMFKPPPPAINLPKDFVNAKLRRKIYPKTPVWILRELAMELNTEEVYRCLDPVDEDVDGQTMQLFPCEVEINGAIFSGSAPDQEISKMLAAENAIQALTFNAVTEGPPNVETSDPLDNAPWAALASLGLFKLFNDWQSKGFGLPLNTVPSTMSAISRGTAVTVKEGNTNPVQPAMRAPVQPMARACKNMPENPTSKHPVSLMNEVYPGTPMTCNQQNDLFEMSASINGKTFVGIARSKKEAKKICAMKALKELKNIEYSDDS